MPTANSVVVGNTDELSHEATCLSIETSLDSALTGSTPSDKGYGVQFNRDSNGKITDVFVFFDDKVPQNEKSAALEKIQRNGGIATVKLVSLGAAENFDGLVLGLTPDTNGDAWNHKTPVLGENGASLQADTRFSGTSPGVSAAAVTIVDSKAASAPNSAECTVDVTSGSYAGVYSLARLSAPTPGDWPTVQVPVKTLVMSAKVCAPAANGDFAAASNRFLRTSLTYWGWHILHFAWEAPTVATTPPTALPFSTSSSNLTIASGTASDIDLPMDGAFHTVRVELIAQAVPGQSGAAFAISVDGGPVVQVQTTSTSLVNAPNPHSSRGMAWGHGITSVPTAFAFSGAYTYVCNWDDLSLQFTLA